MKRSPDGTFSMDNVYSGHWSTDCNRVKYITMSNKKVNCKDNETRVVIFLRSNHPTSALMANYSGIRTLERSNSAFPVA